MWKEKLEAALKAARSIAVKARNEGRELTASEMKAFDTEVAKADEARAKLKAIEESDRRFQQIGAINGDGSKSGNVLSFKGMSARVKSQMAERGGFNVKALVAAGSQVTPAQTIESPVSQGKPATGLLDLLPVRFIEDGDEYSYLTQTTRTNNAAPVAPGGLKPTSVYTLKRQTDNLRVIAHLSEPIPEYWLKDSADLTQFLDQEMAYGLQVALENQALNGNGEDPNMLGLLEVSGIQVQPFVTSQIRTVRSAITKVEVLGYIANGLALNPLDWETIETIEDGNDRYLLGNEGSPVDRAARRLWGVPVALTTGVAQGSGVLLSEGSVGIVMDPNVDMAFGRNGDDFGRNQLRARAEGRFNLEPWRHTGIVEIDLAA